jgi:protein-tyrosine phosphatase
MPKKNENQFKFWMFTLLFCASTTWAASPDLKPNEVFLILNAPEVNPKTQKIKPDQGPPRNWRTSNDAFRADLKKLNQTVLPSREGLDTLQISGSAEFSQGQLEYMKGKLKGKNLLVIDLRQEPHGFVGPWAVSWFAQDDALNAGKPVTQVLQDEGTRLNGLKKQKNVTVTKWVEAEGDSEESKWNTVKFTFPAKSIQSEQDLLSQNKVDYFRIAAPDHQQPQKEDIDRFVEKFRTIKNDQWVHFHCAAGKGRTTTFMIMYDMMRNCSKVSAADIIERQRLLGGLDIHQSEGKGEKRKNWAEARAKYIQKFYDYCKAEGPTFKRNWSEWLAGAK